MPMWLWTMTMVAKRIERERLEAQGPPADREPAEPRKRPRRFKRR
jgi:hypothetical protein